MAVFSMFFGLVLRFQDLRRKSA